MTMRMVCKSFHCVAIAALACGRASAGELPTLDAIQAAWKQRTKAVSSSQLIWTEVHTRPKGEPVDPDDNTPLPEDLNTTFFKKMILSGDKFRIAGKGKARHFQTKTLQPFEFTAVFNGVGRSLHDFPGRKRNLGYIVKSAKGLADISYRPAYLSLDPGNGNLGRIDLRNYRITPKLVTINGRNCVLVERQDQGGDNALYLDVERQFVIIRSVTLEGTHVYRQIDIAYDCDGNGVWYPKSWLLDTRKFGGGSSELRISGTTKNFKSPYASTDRDFELEFPPSTHIYDLTNPKPGEIF